MKRNDRIKLAFTRNWRFPGRERLTTLFKPSAQLKSTLKNGIIWLSDEDIAMHTTADNYIEWSILSSGTYEDEIGKLIRISLKPGFTALDIGANIGLQSLRMSQCVGENGQVYAFEPLNYLQEKFKKNLALNCVSNVTLFPYALSDEGAEANFNIDPNLWNQGAFNLSEKSAGPEIQKVFIKVADDIPEIQELKSIALIKIDVEGFEFKVMQGLKNTLEKHNPRIIFEYDSNYWDRTSQSINDCYSFLRSLNYVLYQVTAIGCEIIADADGIRSGNLFCIPG